MWMDEVFGRFCEQSPFSVMTRATLEFLFADSCLDQVFHDNAQVQYEKQLAFSTVTTLLTQVVLRLRPSVCNAYHRHGHVDAALKCVYEKLQHTELAVCSALVAQTAERAQQVLDCWPQAKRPDPIAGLRLRIFDGNFLGGTQHRLKPLRDDGAAALPGMSVVMRDDRSGLLPRVALREDAYTNERALLEELLSWIEANDLIVADRAYCWFDFLLGLIDRGAYFNIRHHEQVGLSYVGELRYVGTTATGDVYEQQVEIGPENRRVKVRCIVIKLFKPTEDGETEVRLLSNVAEEKADAIVLADLYLRRWTIEHAFQEMTEQLRCEVNTLGYPKAALFGFSLAIRAYNLLVIMKGALATEHGQEKVEKELSTYEMAQEISQDTSGLEIALPEEYWERFATMEVKTFAEWLAELARSVRWQRYRKAKRSLKKVPNHQTDDPPKTKGGRKRPHVSTARVLRDYHKKKRKARSP
jgi:hypothetical protein